MRCFIAAGGRGYDPEMFVITRTILKTEIGPGGVFLLNRILFNIKEVIL